MLPHVWDIRGGFLSFTPIPDISNALMRPRRPMNCCLQLVTYIHTYIYFFIALTFNIHLTMAEVRSKRRLFPLIFIFKIFPNILDIDCFSHTLDHVGAKFNTTILTKFINHWFLLFACSPLANFC